MANKRIRALSLLISALIALSCPAAAFADDDFDVEENSRQLSELNEEESGYREELSRTEEEIESKKQRSEELQQQITELNEKIKTSTQKIDKLNGEINEKQKLIDEKTAEIQDILTLLGQRMRAVHTAGDTTALEIILGAKSFSDFVDKSEMIRTMSEYDKNLIDGIQEQMDAIAAEQKILKDKKLQVEEEKSELEKNKTKVNKLIEENTRIIEELMDKEEKLRNDIEENEAKQKEIEDAIAEYNRKKAQQNGDVILVPHTGDGWVWPCPGFTYLTSTFEEWRGTKNHGALDIAEAGIYGAPVVACCDGYVFASNDYCPHDYGKFSSCGCGGGYGKYIMIDHGDGKISIYGHLSDLTVYAGQYVSAGQLIGYVGTTGYSTGPHLHFETRYNGVRYDPLTEYR